MKANPICRDCGVELNDENWYPSRKKGRHYICKSCNDKRYKEWRKANPRRAKASWTRGNRKQGMRPFYENKECAAYLGVHIAEEVLSQAFKNVKQMPYGNPGFDLICNHNKLIDVKSSCKQKNRGGWEFHIEQNHIADFFLCLAFDNRRDLNPLHAWLIPGVKVSHLKNAGISPSTVHKWDAYRLDITKVATCCNTLRQEHK